MDDELPPASIADAAQADGRLNSALDRSYSQESLDSTRSEDDSLPAYDRVALVRENQPNIQLSIRQGDGSQLAVAACDIDSIEQCVDTAHAF